MIIINTKYDCIYKMTAIKKILSHPKIKYQYNLLIKLILKSIYALCSEKKFTFFKKTTVQDILTNYCDIITNRKSENERLTENVENREKVRKFSRKIRKLSTKIKKFDNVLLV